MPTGPVVGLLEMRILPLSADLVIVGYEGLAAYDLSGETPRALDVPEFAADRVPLLEPTASWTGVPAYAKVVLHVKHGRYTATLVFRKST